MTYDELLQRVKSKFINNEQGATMCVTTEAMLRKSLISVMELHKPWSMETGPEGDSETETVMGCECIPELPAFLNPWPCQTIQAIQKELA